MTGRPNERPYVHTFSCNSLTDHRFVCLSGYSGYQFVSPDLIMTLQLTRFDTVYHST